MKNEFEKKPLQRENLMKCNVRVTVTLTLSHCQHSCAINPATAIASAFTQT